MFWLDEEIGWMVVVESLVIILLEWVVMYGYIIDGLDPFEINAENFNVLVVIVGVLVGEYVHCVGVIGQLVLYVEGVKIHGVMVKVEGYFNVMVIVMRAF